jgi:plastocyanin
MTTAVDVKDNSFDPDLIQVSPGATVTWTWNATSNPHNVTFTNASITSSSTQNSGTFATAMPTTAGDYAYQCTIHSGMTGTVRVE